MSSPEVNQLIKKLGESRFQTLQENMRAISARFRDRTTRMKAEAVTALPISDEDIQNLDKEVEDKQKNNVLIVDEYLDDLAAESGGSWFIRICRLFVPVFIHPQSNFRMAMIGLQTITFLYNAWSIPLRVCFHIYQSGENSRHWALVDYLADSIYLLDTLVYQPRVLFLNPSGIYEKNRKEIIRHYVKEGTFVKDALSLLPLDLLYFWTGFVGPATLLRLPRLLRSYNFSVFFDRLDAALPFPMFIRLTRTVNVMLYLIHLSACSYFAFSDWAGIGSSVFVYDGYGSAYAKSFYVCLKTSISVGLNPKPDRNKPAEMVFMGSLWLLGIFVFAVLMGNVQDIIAQATHNQDEYMFKFDQISQYMYRMNIPQETMDRVKQWCQYTWKTQKSFDELGILEFLPSKMRTDVALDVHYNTLKNVKLFHGCNIGLLKALVLKLQPMLFLPGDYICLKGDVGKEMFIISTGQVQVVGGPNDSLVFVTLGAGICFGEIALLGSGRMNRRTANVRAHGFTSLYVLFKEDLNAALNDYPEDRLLLGKKAQKAAKEVAAKQAETEKKASQMKQDMLNVVVPLERPRQPLILSTVDQVINADPETKDRIRAAKVDAEAASNSVEDLKARNTQVKQLPKAQVHRSILGRIKR